MSPSEYFISWNVPVPLTACAAKSTALEDAGQPPAEARRSLVQEVPHFGGVDGILSSKNPGRLNRSTRAWCRRLQLPTRRFGVQRPLKEYRIPKAQGSKQPTTPLKGAVLQSPRLRLGSEHGRNPRTARKHKKLNRQTSGALLGGDPPPRPPDAARFS